MRHRAPAEILLVGVIALAACTAGVPDPNPTSSAAQDGSGLSAPTDPVALEEVAAFGGVVSLHAGADCTATLIDTGVEEGPAYLLTTARCVGGAGRSAQETVLGQEWTGTAEFFRAAGNLGATVTVDVAELAYATMRDTDAAIVRLDATLGALERLGARAVRIAGSEPRSADAVVNVAVPTEGLEPDAIVMRRGECTLGGPYTLVESSWLWFHVWANDCPGDLEGSNGSPLLLLHDGAPGEVVAMIGTTSAGAGSADGGACTAGRPCRLTGTGVEAVDARYAQSVAGVGRCFDVASGRFSVGGECPLPLSDVWAERGGGTFRGAGLPDAAGQLPEASFVAVAVGILQTVLVPIGDGTACADKETYRNAMTVVVPRAGAPWEAVGVVVMPELPETEGLFLLCAARGPGYELSAAVLFEVDRTPPLFAADATVEPLDDGVVVRPELRPPELSSVRFRWGAPESTDCDDPDTFADSFVAPLVLDATELPAVYCIYGLDAAGNRTPVTVIDIPAP